MLVQTAHVRLKRPASSLSPPCTAVTFPEYSVILSMQCVSQPSWLSSDEYCYIFYRPKERVNFTEMAPNLRIRMGIQNQVPFLVILSLFHFFRQPYIAKELWYKKLYTPSCYFTLIDYAWRTLSHFLNFLYPFSIMVDSFPLW